MFRSNSLPSQLSVQMKPGLVYGIRSSSPPSSHCSPNFVREVKDNPKTKEEGDDPGYSACKLSLSPWALCQRQCQSCKRGALHLVYIILTLITVVIPRSVGGYHASLSRSRPGFESQRGNLFSSIPRETRRVSRHEHNFFLPLQMSTPRIDHRLACVCSCWCPSGEMRGLPDNKTHTCARAHTC